MGETNPTFSLLCFKSLKRNGRRSNGHGMPEEAMALKNERLKMTRLREKRAEE